MHQNTREKSGRWARFSLRWLLIIVTLVALGFGWVTKRYLQPLLAHDQIIAMGGGTLSTNVSGVYEIQLSQSRIVDSDLRVLDKFWGVAKLWLNDTDVTDDCLEFLLNHQELVFIDLRGTRVSDAAVTTLQRSLPDCKIVTDSMPLAEQSKYLRGYSCSRPNCGTRFQNAVGVCPRCGVDCKR